MIPQEYLSMSELDLRTLCIWREARGEGALGRRGVGWVVQNRIERPCWWGSTAHRVILCPFQFSSFNQNDPQHDLWPTDNSPSEVGCRAIAQSIMDDTDTDITNGATNYYDVSIDFPVAWGDPSLYLNTLNVGRFRFWKLLVKGAVN